MDTTSPRRRLGATLAAASLVGAVLALGAAPSALAVEDVTTDRIAGQNRFETAAEVALAGFDNGSDTVVVASGRAFPDALAGSALALPILLTERDTLPAVTRDAIEDLGADSILLLGGPAAVSAAVASELSELGTVERVAGIDRYETAAEIATSVGDAGSHDDLVTAIVATGRDFADALAGGPLAGVGDGTDPFPVLLTSSVVPDATADAIDELGIEQVIILGGTAAVPSSVETELESLTGNPAIRLAGTNRYATAVDVAEAALADFGFDDTGALLASGQGFADALAGGPLGAAWNMPILLTETVRLSDATEDFFVEHAPTIETITALGGTAAVSDGALSAAEKAAETPPEVRVNESVVVSPQSNVTQENGTSREYTITNVTGPIDIALAPCGRVTTGADGSTVFVDSDNSGIADGTADASTAADEADFPGYISEINGDAQPSDSGHTLVNDDYADDVDPQDDGTVVFEVSGPSSLSDVSSCMRPVAFYDLNSDDGLNMAAGAPTEEFGTGGETRFTPDAAEQGVFNVNVDFNDDTANTFDGCTREAQVGGEELVNEAECFTYSYDANDSYQIFGKTATMAEFESLLSTDDDVKGTYYPDSARTSTFNLYENDAPAPPTDNPTEDDSEQQSPVVLHLIESSTPTTDAYVLYRYKKTGTEACPTVAANVLSKAPYTKLAGEVKDPNLGGGPPSQNSRFTMIDESAGAGVWCYLPIAVDDFGEGPAGDPIEVTVLGGNVAPSLDHASATDDPTELDPAAGKGALTQGDVHTFDFSEPITLRPGATYTVDSADPADESNETITCGFQGTSCEVDGTTVTITVGLILAESTDKYPLKIVSISGFEDAEGLNTTVKDDTIELT